MINISAKIALGIIVLFMSSLTFSMSREYRGGEVSILIKHNKPCFYIENKDLSGIYYINLFEKKGIKNIGEYTSNFQEEYPKKTSCISSSTFSNHNYKENKPYLVVITTDKGLSFGTSFCVAERNGTKEIQDFVGQCEYKKESLWEKILKFLGKGKYF